jgi:PAS domain S-box-containing protein
MTVTRVADGTFIDVNDAFLRMFEFRREEVLGRTSVELRMWTADERRALIQKQRESGGLQGSELQARSRSGRLLTILFSSKPVELGGEPCLVTTMIDITARKQAEAERRVAEQSLREAHQRLRDVIDGLGPAMFVGLLTTDGILVEANRPALAAAGLTPEDVLGKPLEETYWWAYDEGAQHRLRQAIERAAQGVPSRYDAQIRVAPGQFLDIDFSLQPLRDQTGRVAYLVPSAVVITERKQAEEALRASSARLAALNAIYQGILAAQSPDEIARIALSHLRRLLDAPRVTLTLFDPEAGEGHLLAVETEGDSRVPAGTRVPLEAGLWDLDALRQGRVQVVGDITALWHLPQTRTVYAEGVRSYVRIPLIVGEQLIGSLNFGLGTTGEPPPEGVEMAREVAGSLAVVLEQARLRVELARHATELEQRVAERTAALQATNDELDAFAYTVAHDLRAPLRAMRGFGEAVAEDYADRLDATGRDYLQRITGAARRMDTLIEDLLAYSRLSRADLALRPVALGAVVSDVLADLKESLEERQAEVRVEEPLPEVIGHRATLAQAVANLVSNAVKYVAPGTRPRVRVWVEGRDGWVRLWVEDNGIGIAPEHQDRVFRVFERLHGSETYPGTGVGLAVVRKGLERMAGRSGVESELGRGSRFWIELRPA